MNQPTKEHPHVVATREKLAAVRGHWNEVQQAAGVSYSWLTKFARGEISNPTIHTLQAVSDGCDVVLAVLDQLPSRKHASASPVN